MLLANPNPVGLSKRHRVGSERGPQSFGVRLQNRTGQAPELVEKLRFNPIVEDVIEVTLGRVTGSPFGAKSRLLLYLILGRKAVFGSVSSRCTARFNGVGNRAIPALIALLGEAVTR